MILQPELSSSTQNSESQDPFSTPNIRDFLDVRISDFMRHASCFMLIDDP